MATMIPDNAEEFCTDGEERVYHWLAGLPVPDDSLLAWYTPDINDREPDFVLFSDDVGLLVLEVKDWAMNQILSANPRMLRLRVGKSMEDRANPFRQAKGYCSALKDKLRADKRLLSKEPGHRGQPKIPVSAGVVLPNINRAEFLARDLDDVLDPSRIFFWDDLHASSPINDDLTAEAFRATLVERFPPPFAFSLSDREKHFLRGVMFPEVRVRLPARSGGGQAYREEQERLRALDHHQEVLARRWDGGHRIIVGPSGSGKTLVLAHKAAFLLKFNPSIERILMVCYNITLVGYIRRLLSALGLPLGERGVEVLHFYELCGRVVGEPIAHEGEEADYYDLVCQQALDNLPGCGLRYDAVLVDEGQDFSDDMFRVVVGLLNPATDNLTIALDEAQDIYKRRNASWQDLGIQARGRIHRLAGVYRNTREIAEFAERFLGTVEATDPPGYAEGRGTGTARSVASAAHPPDGPHQLGLLDEVFAHHGPQPELDRFADLAGVLASLPRTIRKLQAEYGYPLAEFAVLYPMHAPPATASAAGQPSPSHSSTLDLPVAIGQALDDNGILWRWTSEDYRAKLAYDITADSVTVSTVHSVKGLDFGCAFLVGFDLLEPSARWTEEQLSSLTYVAITRARTHLYVPHMRRNALVERMSAGFR